jgi:SPP1 gp7 family putative phage head morphogenesis protein
MPDINLSFALGLKPEEGIKYFEAKGYKISWDYWEVWKWAHSQSFTIAKVMRLDILQDIRNELSKALNEGLTFEEFKRNLIPILKTNGWYGKLNPEEMLKLGLITKEKAESLEPNKYYQLGSPYRLKTIYRTNLQTSFMAGRFRSQIDNAEDRPYWMYVAILDSRTRPEHRELDGKIFLYNDPFWDIYYPPNGWGCRCRVRTLTKAEFERRKVKLYTLSDIKIKPDPGWDYNPGKESFRVDLNKYDSEISDLEG